MEPLVTCVWCRTIIPFGVTICPKCPRRTHQSFWPGEYFRVDALPSPTRQQLEEAALVDYQWALGRAHKIGEDGVKRARSLYEVELELARRPRRPKRKLPG